MPVYRPAQVIRFTYNHPVRDEYSGDKYKEVLVLNPNWQGKMHGIDLKRLTDAEREVLRAIFDRDTVVGEHHIPLVNDILRRMNPKREIKNPLSFYHKFVSIFLKNKDAYRQYEFRYMAGVSIVRQTQVKGQTTDPKPLFHKIEKKTSPEEQQKKLDLIKKIAAEKGVGVSKMAGQPRPTTPTGTKGTVKPMGTIPTAGPGPKKGGT